MSIPKTEEQRERKRARDRLRQQSLTRKPLTDAQREAKRLIEAKRVRTPERMARKLAAQRERNAWRKVHRLYLTLLRQRGVIA